jgi:hypothetical protein
MRVSDILEEEERERGNNEETAQSERGETKI